MNLPIILQQYHLGYQSILWHFLYFWDGTIVIALAFFNLALWIIDAFNRSKELKKQFELKINESRCKH